MKPDRETLRHLYEDDRSSTRQIGEKYGVAHITVRRWLTGYGIEVRPTGRGLVNRGIVEPTADELHHMVHVEHLSYRDIAGRYGVDFTAIPHWLERYNVPRPTVWGTRRKGRKIRLPGPEELRHRREYGESLRSIAASYGVPHAAISALCQQHGIPVDRDGWDNGRRYPCLDGHEGRSVYEQRVDNWLSEHGLAHEVEPRYPFDLRCRADFLVGDTYIEVWGVTENATYAKRKARKIQQCRKHNLPLIQINCWQFAKGRRWWRPLEKLLQDPVGDLF